MSSNNGNEHPKLDRRTRPLGARAALANSDALRALAESEYLTDESARRLAPKQGHYPENAGLLVLSGPEVGRRFRIPKSITSIGRGTPSDIQLLTGGVSRTHARIEFHSGRYMLVDLNSTNGTRVNGLTIHAHPLVHGDLLQIGETPLVFLLSEKLEDAYQRELYRLSTTDEAAETFNFHYFTQAMEREIARANFYQRPLSMLLLHVEGLPALTKKASFGANDPAVRLVANRVQKQLRPGDLIAHGARGDFYLLLPETCREAAEIFGEQLVSAVQEKPFAIDEGEIELQLSFGVADTQNELSSLNAAARATSRYTSNESHPAVRDTDEDFVN